MLPARERREPAAARMLAGGASCGCGDTLQALRCCCLLPAPTCSDSQYRLCDHTSCTLGHQRIAQAFKVFSTSAYVFHFSYKRATAVYCTQAKQDFIYLSPCLSFLIQHETCTVYSIVYLLVFLPFIIKCDDHAISQVHRHHLNLVASASASFVVIALPLNSHSYSS